MDELDEIDRVLHSLRTNWTTYGVWADWFDEKGCEGIGTTLRELGESGPKDHILHTAEERGMWLFHELIRRHSVDLDKFGFDVFRFYDLIPEAVRSIVTATPTPPFVDIIGHGEVRHVGRFSALTPGVIAHCDCGTRNRQPFFQIMCDTLWLYDPTVYRVIRLEARKLSRRIVFGKRQGYLMVFRHVGQCGSCGQVITDDPPQPWHISAQIEPYSMDHFKLEKARELLVRR